MLVTIGDLLEEVLVQLPLEPPRGETTRVRSVRVRGGSAANVAAITAERGGPSRFVGAVGSDAIGRTLAEDLVRRGVDTRIVHSGGTGVRITLVGGGRRTHLVDRGASARLGHTNADLLEGATQVFVPAATFLEDPLAEATHSLLEEAAARRVPVVLGSLETSDVGAYGAEAFLSFVELLRPDAVLLNREEHAALGMPADQPLPGALVTVVTDGERPAQVVNDRGLRQDVRAHPVESIRDRTGVGDGFAAGYLEARRAGADPVAAADAGHRVAGLVLRYLGPTTLGA